MAATTPTTKLEAINSMLSVIGEAPVSTLEGGQNADTVMAQAILEEALRETLEEGWHFNTEYEIPLVPDIAGEIVLPTNYARVDVQKVNAPSYAELTFRAGKLYNLTEHTFVFTSTVKVDAVMLLEFEDIPQAARKYIHTRAARIFQDRVVGSTEHHSFNLRDEINARKNLRAMEGETADHNIFNSPSLAASYRRGILERIR
jgi:hypothetical protein